MLPQDPKEIPSQNEPPPDKQRSKDDMKFSNSGAPAETEGLQCMVMLYDT